MKETILIVDDEKDIRDLLQYNLKKADYIVYTAENGEEGVEIAKKIKPNLILLDVMMPVCDGIEACQIIREDSTLNKTIITFLTSRAEDYTQIAGFKAGADDFITKPIRPRVFLSRVEALLRRESSKNRENNSSDIQIDRDKFIVFVKGTEIIIPKKEFELLELLLSNTEKVFTRDQILAQVWGNDAIVGERTIDVHVRKLREKLGDDYIRTIKGVGYRFNQK